MREHIAQFAREAAAGLDISDPIVEMGARPASGQEAGFDLRSLFPGRTYIGADIQAGERVDQIEDIHASASPMTASAPSSPWTPWSTWPIPCAPCKRCGGSCDPAVWP